MDAPPEVPLDAPARFDVQREIAAGMAGAAAFALGFLTLAYALRNSGNRAVSAQIRLDLINGVVLGVLFTVGISSLQRILLRAPILGSATMFAVLALVHAVFIDTRPERWIHMATIDAGVIASAVTVALTLRRLRLSR